MKKTKLSILTTIILMIMLSSTVAIVIWTSGNTNVNLSISGLDAYINYTKGTDVLTGNLTAGIDYTTGISTEIELWKSPLAENREIYGHIYLDIKELGTNLKEEPALKWAIVSNDEILDHGNFIEREVGDTVSLVVNIPLSTEKETYTVYIWLDAMYDINKDISGETLSSIVRAEATEEKIEYVVNIEYEPIIDTTPGVLAGTGTEDDPYKVESIEDLITLSKTTNADQNNRYYEKYVRLERTLNFNYEGSYVDSENTTMFGDYNGDGVIEGIKKEVTSGQGFIPIGISLAPNYRYFRGTFLGNNNAILNLYINYNDNSSYISGSIGLFGLYSSLTTLKDLTVTGNINVSTNSSSNINVGGISGAILYNNIDKCNNYCNINITNNGTGEIFAGGITGTTNSNITDSKNLGYLKIKNSSNNNVLVGGITGYVDYVSSNKEIEKNKNYGEIVVDEIVVDSGARKVSIGGIVGGGEPAISTMNINYGDISLNNNDGVGGTYYIGGIIGLNHRNANRNINYGNIKGYVGNSVLYLGGIIGENNANVTENINMKTGTIFSKNANSANYVGGIVGHTFINSNKEYIVSSCYNLANINATRIVGGIVGWNYSETVKNSYNIGILNTSNSNIKSGGIVGGNGGAGIITNSYYLNTTAKVLYGIGSPPNITNSGSKTSEEMKTSSFVDLLNQGLETPVWVMDTNNINNGYPILSFQNK